MYRFEYLLTLFSAWMLCLELGHVEDFLFNDDPEVRGIAVARNMTLRELCRH